MCWGCGKGDWRVVGGVEKCVGYMTICDDLLQRRDKTGAQLDARTI